MLSNDLVADRLYSMLGPMPSEFNEIDALLDTLPSEIRAQLELLIGSLPNSNPRLSSPGSPVMKSDIPL